MDDMKLTADVAASMRATAGAGAVETAASVAKLSGVGSWLTSLIPANVIKAAADGAVLPLVVFTLVFALAARRIDAALRESLIALFSGIANAMTRIIGFILALAPVGIFALVLAAVSRGGVAIAGAMGYYVIAVSLALVLFALLMYPVASMVGRIPLGWFTRAVFPAQAVALSSGSSVSSLPALVEGARALEFPPPVTGVVLPASVSAFRVATPITWLVGALFLARLYGVTVGGAAMLTIAATAIALSFTIPAVPQGAQLVLAPLLARYGIPIEGVALLIAVDYDSGSRWHDDQRDGRHGGRCGRVARGRCGEAGRASHHPSMRDGEFQIRGTGRARWSMLALVVVACSKQDAPVPVGASTPVAAATPGVGTCPATGQWAECSILYRLSDRASSRKSIPAPSRKKRRSRASRSS
jgi:hypothetical protein